MNELVFTVVSFIVMVVGVVVIPPIVEMCFSISFDEAYRRWKLNQDGRRY